MRTALISLMLVVHSVTDLQSRQIFWPLTAAAAFIGSIYGSVFLHQPIVQIACGMIPALMLLPFSLGRRAPVGKGDVIVVGACGTILGFTGTMELLVTALFLTGVFGLILLLIKKCDHRMRLPFLPFLLTAWIFYLAAG